MIKSTLALLLILVLALPIHSDSMLANGSFNFGDLTGWTEAGPTTISTWHGALPVPVQVFSDGAPMHVTRVVLWDAGDRHIARVDTASSVKPVDKYAVGWTIAGSPVMGYPWISQVFRVAPGKYTANITWHIVAGRATGEQKTSQPAPPTASKPAKNKQKPASTASGDTKPETPAEVKEQAAAQLESAPKPTSSGPKSIGGLLIINTDSNLNAFSKTGSVYTNGVWDDESKGQWIQRNVSDLPIETTSGYIELRLQLDNLIKDNPKVPITADRYYYVAFDSVGINLTAVGAIATPPQDPRPTGVIKEK